MDSKYWDEIYQTRSENDLSWFQETPKRSLELISELGLTAQDSIIDIGGGDSRLIDHLLKKGIRKISVLDISSAALSRAKTRLGENSKSVTFIDSDVTKFNPPEKYKLWHDRAAFHFLINDHDKTTYLETANQAITPGGFLIISGFSKTGPEKCSGLVVSRNSEADLKSFFGKYFLNIRCFEDKHTTPWDTEQNFVYCIFRKKQ
jgi:ubiquinone/menaquinone biosynthesis C-methylase UbiE